MRKKVTSNVQTPSKRTKLTVSERTPASTATSVSYTDTGYVVLRNRDVKRKEQITDHMPSDQER